MPLQEGTSNNPLTYAVMGGHATIVKYLVNEARADQSKVHQVTFVQTVMT